MERRNFLKSAAVAGLGAVAAGQAGAQGNQSPLPGAGGGPAGKPRQRAENPAMQYRELGTTGERVSAIGMGGFHIGKTPDSADSIKLVRAGIDRGISFMDNCWDYNDGTSELRMGEALRDGYREKVFLMTKIDGRTAQEYNRQLEQSLARLRTDQIDLVQFHEVIRYEDPDRIFAKGGAIEAAMAARQAGKIRYIGFTGHKDPAIHLRMFEVAKANNFHFDTVQMPVNVMDAHFRSFTKQVIPVAQAAGTGVLAMKTFGDHYILDSGVVQPIEALQWSLSQPVSVVITGIDSMPILDQAFAAIKDFQPMPAAQQAALLQRTEQLAMTGSTELFKTSQHYDGTAGNPKWLG